MDFSLTSYYYFISLNFLRKQDSNSNGSYYYKNDNGSTYYRSPSGKSFYKKPVEKELEAFTEALSLEDKERKKKLTREMWGRELKEEDDEENDENDVDDQNSDDDENEEDSYEEKEEYVCFYSNMCR